MALNPPIAGDGTPLRVQGEYLILERKNMEIELKIPTLKTIAAKGTLFLSTARMVFVNEKHSSDSFKSFDIPLAFMFTEKFNQPIFGANYLSGKVKPLYGVIPGDAEFKVWFMSGGCNKFLKLLAALLEQIRRAPSTGPNQAFMNSISTGHIAQNTAYADPNDPSVIYINQPQQSWDSNLAAQRPANYYYQNTGLGTSGPGKVYASGAPVAPSGENQQYLMQNQYQPIPQPPTQAQTGSYAPPPVGSPVGVPAGGYNQAPAGGFNQVPSGGYQAPYGGQQSIPQTQQAPGVPMQMIPQTAPTGTGAQMYPQFNGQGQQQPPFQPAQQPPQTGNYYGFFGPQLQRNN